MTLDELARTLPNGFHDAALHSLALDFNLRTAELLLEIWVGDPHAPPAKTVLLEGDSHARQWELALGDVVAVPLGARESMGVVWADNLNPNPRLHNRLKDVDEKLDVPPLKPELRQFVDWVSNYTLASRGMVLRMALRMGEHLGPGRERVGVRLGGYSHVAKQSHNPLGGHHARSAAQQHRRRDGRDRRRHGDR